ncbi:MAG: hypothetical protein CBD97_02195 [Pelagibacteraceae bacterium TMED237]|nr:MAG: hypothetical protein CBD97_02195 [Pelagibacteraceae bacterium TMED237]
MNLPSQNYANKINLILKKIFKEENTKILKSAKLISRSYKKGGQLFIFGTGHSNLLAEESFHRAGGYAAACPIRSEEINYSKGTKKGTELERTENVAKRALQKYKLSSKDVLMIVSNSGVNHAPVEAALLAKKKKIKTIALTSYKFSKQAPLSKLKKRLYEICDIYIDNKIPPGDAIVGINNMMVGPASTITGSFILNSILVEVANLLKNEKIFPFYISVNMPGAKENNDKLVKKYKESNPHL